MQWADVRRVHGTDVADGLRERLSSGAQAILAALSSIGRCRSTPLLDRTTGLVSESIEAVAPHLIRLRATRATSPHDLLR